jgi:hypothetical protein
MGGEVQPGDACTRCGEVIRVAHADSSGVESAFDSQIPHLTCGCDNVSGPTNTPQP